MKTQSFSIGGMTCAACSARVERALGRLEGMQRASVNLASEKASVVYDPLVLRPSAIREAVVKAGYKVLENQTAGEDAIRRKREISTLRLRFFVSLCFTVPLFYIAMAPMISFIKLPFPAALEPMSFPLRYALAELLLVTPVVIAGRRFYSAGFKNLFCLAPNMDSLIALGTTAAIGFSLYNLFLIAAGNAHAVESLYFETAGMIITLILLGKTLETSSKGKTGEAIKKLMALSPKTAIIVLADGTEKEIPIDELVPGDIVRVLPGAKIPVDGVVLEGESAIDESMLSGESMPVDKKPGCKVYGATLNANGTLLFRAEKVGGDTALAQIIRLVEEAQGSKAPIAQLADIVSGYFVPIVCGIALVAGIAWFAAASTHLVTLPHGKTALEFSLTVFISVLVIACPCALGLATPTAIMVGIGKGAESGILIKSGEALETAHKTGAVIFDKTGTLTEGRPAFAGIVPAAGIDENYLLQIAASAEKVSEHPLGKAIVEEAEKRGLALFAVEQFKAVPGKGIEAALSGAESSIAAVIGNAALMENYAVGRAELEALTKALAAEGKTPMYAALGSASAETRLKFAGIIAVADVLKKNSAAAVEELRRMDLDVVMITGDNKQTAAAIAREAGIERVLAEVLPEDKAAEIQKLQREGRITAMVGDGINDAPALARADIGIAIGSGTDAAVESADIVLVRGDIRDVAKAIRLSKNTMRTIKQNLFWAFGYNVLGIPVAAGLLYLFGGPLLNPVFAAAAMSMSSVSVLSNALRLKRRKL